MNSLSEELNELKHDSRDYKHIVFELIKYDHLLNTKLHPSMFLPWDKENNCPLEKPTGWGSYYNPDNPLPDEYAQEWKQYQQAESEVIFEGWKVDLIEHGAIFLRQGDYSLILEKTGSFVFAESISHAYRTVETIADIHKHVELKQE